MKILLDKEISLKAKGIYFLIIELQNQSMDISLKTLREYVTDGQRGVTTALKELMESGYLERNVVREKNLIKSYEYKIKK
jgi:CTP-dependent riboflavin kinase